jgi:hypothetical protein
MFGSSYANAREPPKLAITVAVIGSLCVVAAFIGSLLLLYSALG